MVYIHVIMYISVCFHCSVQTFIPGQVQIEQIFQPYLVSVKSIKKVTSSQEQVQEYCNSRIEASFRV